MDIWIYKYIYLYMYIFIYMDIYKLSDLREHPQKSGD